VIPSLDIEVDADGRLLPGVLGLPPDATRVVVFAHGSGSSRFSPRNVAVAEAFHGDGLATLLFDLLTEEEAADRRNVFDIELLGRRLVSAVEWTRAREDVGDLPLGLFGASTGGAAAIVAAAHAPDRVASVVSRGGRPDLAGRALLLIEAPTLLIVGGLDTDVLRLNRQARTLMENAETRLQVVPGATHLFEEPGALEEVAVLASEWIRGRG
jgi:pimeloyl-ACP methyl ester carboxylesterase